MIWDTQYHCGTVPNGIGEALGCVEEWAKDLVLANQQAQGFAKSLCLIGVFETLHPTLQEWLPSMCSALGVDFAEARKKELPK